MSSRKILDLDDDDAADIDMGGGDPLPNSDADDADDTDDADDADDDMDDRESEAQTPTPSPPPPSSAPSPSPSPSPPSSHNPSPSDYHRVRIDIEDMGAALPLRQRSGHPIEALNKCKASTALRRNYG